MMSFRGVIFSIVNGCPKCLSSLVPAAATVTISRMARAANANFFIGTSINGWCS